MKRFFAALLLPLFCTPLLQGQEAYFISEIDGQYYTLEQRMATHQVNGAALTVVRNLQLDTSLYLGFRDQAQQLPVDQNTLFQMGGMTVPLIKFAVVRLANDGRIDLDAPVNRYLQGWRLPEKGFTRRRPVTVRDLLLQRRGFNDVYKPQGYAPGAELPGWTQIMAGAPPSNLPPLNLKKNKGRRNSMANVMILQRLLEDVHGQPLPQVIRATVFEPLGMTRSVITAALDERQQQNACVGYEEDGTPIPGKRRIYPELAHSGLWSTPTDYARFVLHLFRAAKGLDNTLIDAELARDCVTPQYRNHSLVLHKDDLNNYWGGAPRGFYCQFTGNLEAGWLVVGCSNRELAWQFVNWELNGRGIAYGLGK